VSEARVCAECGETAVRSGRGWDHGVPGPCELLPGCGTRLVIPWAQWLAEQEAGE
jgi:hypothetical protein